VGTRSSRVSVKSRPAPLKRKTAPTQQQQQQQQLEVDNESGAASQAMLQDAAAHYSCSDTTREGASSEKSPGKKQVMFPQVTDDLSDSQKVIMGIISKVRHKNKDPLEAEKALSAMEINLLKRYVGSPFLRPAHSVSESKSDCYFNPYMFFSMCLCC
jgi:signal recognition particle GTPase